MDGQPFAADRPFGTVGARPRSVSRLVTVALVALLAVPMSVLTPPETITLRHGGTAAEAKGNKGKKGKKKDPSGTPQYTTVTRTVRQSVTQTFANAGAITIPTSGSEGKASPYPSTVEVSGFTNGVMTDVNLVLNDFTHTNPIDVDIQLLHNPPLQGAIVMSDVGLGGGVTDLDLTLDDEAAAALPLSSPLTSGSFRPTNTETASDAFPSPSPGPTSDVALSTFDASNPNGTWYLWVMDDANLDVGDIGGGWALQITADHDVQIEEQVPVPAQTKDKKVKKKNKGKGRR